MRVEDITSRENAWIKKLIRLQNQAKDRRKEQAFVLEGLRTLKDAAENGVTLEQLFFSASVYTAHMDDCEALFSHAKRLYRLSDELFLKVCDTKTPQGLLAIVPMPDIIHKSLSPIGRYLALENLQDPANLGAIARTAEALGLDGLILSKDTCDPFCPKALRASMGTLCRLPLYGCEDLTDFLRKSGLTRYACVVHGQSVPIRDVTFSDGCVSVIGNEANGLSEELIRSCEYSITIPMAGRAESLNASVAASLVMWEMLG